MAETLEARVGDRLRASLDALLQAAQFQLSYRFLSPAPPPLADAAAPAAMEVPELVVDFSGADAGRLLANDGELLRALEHLAFETLQLGAGEHHRLIFDCQGRRQMRVEELHTLAQLAAQQVLKTGVPYAFAPMNSRDRRTVHLALHGLEGVSSESEGESRDRHVVIRSLSAAQAPAPRAGRKEYRRL